MFFGGLTALTGIGFTIQSGEILGLIGPNGAGKTTLFNVITGVYTPSSGTIHFKGALLSHLKPHQICQKGISRTYQLVRPFPELTVLQNVLVGIHFGQESQKKSDQDAESEAMELLDFLDLQDKARLSAKSLTMGERKRLEIARALATHPELLLLDEVIAGLTPTEVTQTMSLIKNIRERGVTIFMIEHIMKAIMDLSDRVIVLHHGEKIAEGTPEEVANDDNVIKAYLGETAKG